MHYWFKAKRYGYGWYPATWQGALIMAGWLGLELINFFVFNPFTNSDQVTIFYFLPITFFLTAILIYICYRTGEPARWRWGDKK